MTMKTNRLNKIISILILISLMGQQLFFADFVYAQSEVQAVNPILHSSEILFDAAPVAMENALALGQLLEEIDQTSNDDLTEETLITAQTHALETAKHAALAEGALTAVADAITAQNYQIYDALDMDATVAVISTDVYTTETKELLLEAGLTISQVQQLETSSEQGFQTRRDIGQNGFSAETETILTDAGFTAEDVDTLEENVAGYGLADATLPDRLAQLQATAAEMNLIRTEALTIYVQLLTRRTLLREFAGESARAITDDDLNAMAEDQLRLLLHIGYLDDLWQDGADRNTGEGQWLFVQRYSERVIDRLDALVVETQNTGLVVDLYLALNIYSTALVAEAGGASLAKTELDTLGDTLADLAGDNLPEGQEARLAEPTLAWRVISKVAMATGVNAQPLLQTLEPELSDTAVVVASTQGKERLFRLAPPALPSSNGSIDEADESNNSAQDHFYASSVNLLPPEVLNFLAAHVGDIANGLNLIWGLLTGQSDNPWVIGANITLSFVPILGEVMDIIALVLEPTAWGKAFAAIGLLASLISDGSELISAIGALIPPALAAIPIAIVAEGVDIGAAILKRADAFLGPAWDIVKRIPFNRAIELGTDMLFHMTDEALDLIGGATHWPHNFGDILNLLQSAKNRVIEPFTALLTRYAGRLDEFFRLGFGDGGFLVGRLLSLSDEAASYSDEVVESIARYGDDLAEQGVELSDEAIDGLGEVVDDAGERGLRSLDEGLNCVIGAVAQAKPFRFAKFSTPKVYQTDAEEKCRLLREVAYRLVGDAAQEWSDETLLGLGRVLDEVGEIGARRLADLGDEMSQSAFALAARRGESIWTDETVEGLAKVFEKNNLTNFVPPDVLADSLSVARYTDEVIADSLDFVNRSDILDRTDDARDVFQWRVNNDLTALDDVNIRLKRTEIPNSQYTQPGGLKEAVESRWGSNLSETRLAEAVGVEAAVQQLLAEGYEEIFVLTRNGGNGPDAIMRGPAPDRIWTIVEGKGTYTGADLEGGLFETLTIGTQGSSEWITVNNGSRYINDIPAELHNDVMDMIRHIQGGGDYKVVVGRGGFGAMPDVSPAAPRPLNYGSNLDQLIDNIEPNSGNWSIDFIFTRLHPP